MQTVDGYIRVSRRMGREGPGYISPDIQREAIQRWAEYKGVTVVAWHEDEDESGGDHDRPGLEAAVARALAGETGGIASWKIDRFSRWTEGGLRDLRRLEEVGARLAFVTEDIDTSGPIGKFVYTILLAQAEYFLSMIKAGWVTAKTRAMSRGVKIGPTPYGYQRSKSRPLAPHPEYAPIVRRAFELAAAEPDPTRKANAAYAYLREHAPEGEPESGEELTPKGRRKLTNRTGRAWHIHRVRRLLRNRAYLGEVRYGDLPPNPNAHPALVSRATWEAAQPAEGAGRAPSADYVLSGIATCAECGGPMIGAGGKVRQYRCSGATNGKGCAAPAMMTVERLEGYVIGTVREALANERPIMYEVGNADTDALAAAEDAMHEAERDLTEFATDATARRLLGDKYHPTMEAKAENVERLRAAYRELAVIAQRKSVPTPATLDDDLPGTLRAVLASVVVTRGRGGKVAGRVVVEFGDAHNLAGVSAA